MVSSVKNGMQPTGKILFNTTELKKESAETIDKAVNQLEDGGKKTTRVLFYGLVPFFISGVSSIATFFGFPNLISIPVAANYTEKAKKIIDPVVDKGWEKSAEVSKKSLKESANRSIDGSNNSIHRSFSWITSWGGKN